MVMREFKRPRVKNDTTPTVSIRGGRFHFNAAFARLADLSLFKSLVYWIDEDERKIGFEFNREAPQGNSYTLENRGRISQYRSAAQDLIKKNLWIRSVASGKSGSPSSFEASKEGKLWSIQLCPAFEYVAKKDDLSGVPSNVTGIYRYLNSSGAVVYIGKGNIRRRAQQDEREDWNFEAIEYSIIDSDEEQFKWEDFWIERYKEKSNGELPAYNRQSGNKS